MAMLATLNPAPFLLEGGPVGIILIHGFTSSPTEMRLLGEYLNERGFTASGILLPGHGTTVDDLTRCKWTDWTDFIAAAYKELQSPCQLVFVGGQSLGSILTTYLAEHQTDLPGAILYAPAIMNPENADLKEQWDQAAQKWGSHVPKSELLQKNELVFSRIWSYDVNPLDIQDQLAELATEAYRDLKNITCPLLLIHSTNDHVVDPNMPSYICETVSSPETKVVTLHQSQHAIPMDIEWETAAEQTYQFLLQHLSPELRADVAAHAQQK